MIAYYSESFSFLEEQIFLGQIQKLRETSRNLSQIPILVLMLLQIGQYH